MKVDAVWSIVGRMTSSRSDDGSGPPVIRMYKDTSWVGSVSGIQNHFLPKSRIGSKWKNGEGKQLIGGRG